MQKKKLFILFTLLVGLLVVGLTISLRPGAQKLVVADPILPRQYGEIFVGKDSMVRFFNGRMFVEYNISSGQSKPLSAEATLPAIKEMRWSQDGNLVGLQSSLHSSADLLGQELKKRG